MPPWREATFLSPFTNTSFTPLKLPPCGHFWYTIWMRDGKWKQIFSMNTEEKQMFRVARSQWAPPPLKFPVDLKFFSVCLINTRLPLQSSFRLLLSHCGQDNTANGSSKFFIWLDGSSVIWNWEWNRTLSSFPGAGRKSTATTVVMLSFCPGMI